MKQTKGKMGIREFAAILFLLIGTKITDDTPTYLYSGAKNAAWISMLLISIALIIPTILLLKVLSVHKGKNLHEINLYLFGKVIGNMVSFILLIFGLLTIVLDSSVYVDIIGTMYFTKTPNFAIFAVLMCVSAYGAKKGVEHIGSVAWLVFFYTKVTLIVALLFTFKEGNSKLLFPILGPGVGGIIKTAAQKLSIFGDFFYAGLIAPVVATYKDFRRGVFLTYLILTVELSVALMLFVMLFDFTSVEILNYPFHETIRYIQIGFLTNVETLFFPFWLVATFIRFSFYIYLFVLLLGGIFKIREFEYLIPLVTVIFILLGIAPETPLITISENRDMTLQVLSPLLFVLPCVMWIIAKIRGDFKNESSV
jgi:spore germination protein (amino acid permease)